MATQSLVRPAAAEVRTMLQRIKMENIERVMTSDLSFGGHRGSSKLMSTSPRQKAPMFHHQQQFDWKQSGFAKKPE